MRKRSGALHCETEEEYTQLAEQTMNTMGIFYDNPQKFQKNKQIAERQKEQEDEDNGVELIDNSPEKLQKIEENQIEETPYEKYHSYQIKLIITGELEPYFIQNIYEFSHKKQDASEIFEKKLKMQQNNINNQNSKILRPFSTTDEEEIDENQENQENEEQLKNQNNQENSLKQNFSLNFENEENFSILNQNEELGLQLSDQSEDQNIINQEQISGQKKKNQRRQRKSQILQEEIDLYENTCFPQNSAEEKNNNLQLNQQENSDDDLEQERLHFFNYTMQDSQDNLDAEEEKKENQQNIENSENLNLNKDQSNLQNNNDNSENSNKNQQQDLFNDFDSNLEKTNFEKFQIQQQQQPRFQQGFDNFEDFKMEDNDNFDNYKMEPNQNTETNISHTLNQNSDQYHNKLDNYQMNENNDLDNKENLQNQNNQINQQNEHNNNDDNNNDNDNDNNEYEDLLNYKFEVNEIPQNKQQFPDIRQKSQTQPQPIVLNAMISPSLNPIAYNNQNNINKKRQQRPSLIPSEQLEFDLNDLKNLRSFDRLNDSQEFHFELEGVQQDYDNQNNEKIQIKDQQIQFQKQFTSQNQIDLIVINQKITLHQEIIYKIWLRNLKIEDDSFLTEIYYDSAEYSIFFYLCHDKENFEKTKKQIQSIQFPDQTKIYLVGIIDEQKERVITNEDLLQYQEQNNIYKTYEVQTQRLQNFFEDLLKILRNESQVDYKIEQDIKEDSFQSQQNLSLKNTTSSEIFKTTSPSN